MAEVEKSGKSEVERDPEAGMESPRAQGEVMPPAWKEVYGGGRFEVRSLFPPFTWLPAYIRFAKGWETARLGISLFQFERSVSQPQTALIFEPSSLEAMLRRETLKRWENCRTRSRVISLQAWDACLFFLLFVGTLCFA